jgi:small subunit ribosomal protein S1
VSLTLRHVQALQVRGKVYATDRDGVYVDIGAKSTAICPITECSIYKIDHPEEAGIEVDSEQDFMILRNDNPNGEMVLSIRRIQYELAWDKCRKLLAEDKTVMGTVRTTAGNGVFTI